MVVLEGVVGSKETMFSLSLVELLKTFQFKVISYKRPQINRNRQLGGGCAIIFNEQRYNVTKLSLGIPDLVEAAWAIFTHKNSALSRQMKVKNIAVGSFYVAPNSQFKDEVKI